MSETEHNLPIEPTTLWKNIESRLGKGDSINKLSKRVHKKYNISENTVFNSHAKKSIPRFDTITAIAEDLGVSLDYLIGKEIITEILDDQNVDIYPKIINTLNSVVDLIAKPHDVHIRFEAISNAEETTLEKLHFMQYPEFGHMSDKKHLMLRVICTGYLRIHGLYPQQDRRDIYTTIEVENCYIAAYGNIYPEKNCNIPNYEIISVYDYVENLFYNYEMASPYKQIRRLFKTYSKERRALGIIGALPPSAFYWFLYYLGSVTKL